MARNVPLAPYLPPDPGAAVPFAPILAGSAATPGHWRGLARAVNLGYSDGCAGNVISQTWLDGQAVSATAAGTYQSQCSWHIPEISGAHLAIRCRVYATGGAPAVGSVRFVSTNGGATVTLSPIGALGWYSTSGADLVVAFAGGYETVSLQCAGNVTIHAVMATYLPQDTVGAWPGADGALAAGPDGAFIPLDEIEFSADEPLSSDVVTVIRDDLAALATRQRVLCSTSALDNAATLAGYYAYLDVAQPLRFVVPGRRGGTEITVSVRATNTTGVASHVYVQVAGVKGAVASAVAAGSESVDVETFNVAAGVASAWSSHTFTVRDQFDPVSGGAPMRYLGFALAAVSWSTALDMERVCVWG